MNSDDSTGREKRLHISSLWLVFQCVCVCFNKQLCLSYQYDQFRPHRYCCITVCSMIALLSFGVSTFFCEFFVVVVDHLYHFFKLNLMCVWFIRIARSTSLVCVYLQHFSYRLNYHLIV